MTQRRRTLPAVSPKVPAELRPLISAMAEILETGEGVRGSPLDRKVTLRDLLDSGIGRLKNGTRAGMPGSLESGFEPPSPNMSTPPAPTGFSAEGGFYGMINLTWDNPVELYGNHAYTTIYRSESDNFANAQLAGRDSGVLYSDYVRDDAADGDSPGQLKGYYYWITFTSTAGVEGPPNSADGTYAEPLADMAYVLDLLTGQIGESELSQAFKGRVEGIEQTVSEQGDLYTLTLNNNGYISGFGAYNDGETADFTVVADRFWIARPGSTQRRVPFIVQDGVVYIDTAMIREASIQEGKLGPITVGKLQRPDGTPVSTVAGLLRADAIDVDSLRIGFGQVTGNLSSSATANNGRPLWMLNRNGGFELNSPGTGGRMEQTGDRISVYDENGRLRVRIGRL